MIKTLKINNRRGAAAVEFAIILPLLVLLLFATIEVGLLIYNKQIITGASREGARAGIVLGLDRENADALETESESVATAYCSDHLITFGDSVDPLKIEAKWKEVKDPVGPSFGDDLSVTVSYDYGFLVLGNLGFSPVTIDSTTVMRLE